MATDILQGTLTGTATAPTTPAPPTPAALIAPTTSGATSGKSLKTDISTLQGAQKSPEMLLNLQKAMTVASQTAYRERQKTDLASAATQFDPTKVSGGTFAGILGNLEQQRGTDVSRIYSATMSTYSNVQEQITNRLQFLQNLKQAEDHFKQELKRKKAELKSANKWEREQFKQKQSNWEKEFALTKLKAQRTINENETYPGTSDNKALFTPVDYSPANVSFNPDKY